ncbi:MAG: heparinase II/III family protein, partial [Gammaproteobacteria bacterium]
MAIEQVKRFAARLRERAAPPLRVVFELPSEDELLRSLDPLASAQMRGAQAAWSAGDRERAIELVVAHFRERDNAPFFLSGHDLREAVARLRRERPEWVSATLAQADRMAGGDFDVYAQTARLLTAEDWAFAPLGPGRDLLHRQRPHRFAFAPRLALAALYGHETACGTLERSVGAWAESCEPVGRFSRRSRPFRASSHVSVYRAVAVSWALAFLAASSRSSVELEFLLLRTILADALSIARSIRRTTRNNHLVADGFGLWYLGSVYPEFRDAARWRSTGLPVFRDELLRQTFPDGTSFEHSVHYQEHTCEMGMAFLALCRAHDWASDAELAGRIRAMMHFQAMLAGRDGSAVAIGDSTEDPLFPLDNDDAWCGPGIRALYSEWFGDALPVDPAVASLQRAFWLGGGRMTGARTGPDPDDRRRLHRFDDSGFALMAANRGRDRLIFRTGPPERQEIVCGHMHFDFLGVHVVIDGNMVVVPSGTYTYRANPNSWPMPYPGWREHFMSARASNGLVLSQGDPLERFLGHMVK